MTYICSVGLGVPKHPISQVKVKQLVKDIFPFPERIINKYLPVFDHAKIDERQLVVERDWFRTSHSFEEKNTLYIKHAIDYSLKAMDDCLTNDYFLNKSIPYEAIDMIAFISSTGISTPSLDVHLMNERPFRENIARMPLWGLGCAGGAIGLSRATDWISANTDKIAIVICCELCSLTFQNEDKAISNLVGTALFGDGVGAALLIGKDSPYLLNKNNLSPKITNYSSYTKKNSTSIMGWDITNNGLEVIFSRKIPSYVNTLWKEHLYAFLEKVNIHEQQIHSIIAHPGGAKVLKVMEGLVSEGQEKLKYSHDVLARHGNMSSATVFYVLRKWMMDQIKAKERSVLCALGPGFSSELLLLEWE